MAGRNTENRVMKQGMQGGCELPINRYWEPKTEGVSLHLTNQTVEFKTQSYENKMLFSLDGTAVHTFLAR